MLLSCMALPTFVVIGSTKSGTTALHQYVSLHPQVFTPATKELRFFSTPERWQLGVPWYERQFAGSEGAVARGETSPQYTQAPLIDGVPARMASVVPHARLVYLVRDPVDRVLSQYRYRVNRGRESRPVEQAVLDPRYLNGSRYAYQLDRYLEHYDPAALLVLPSEALRRQPTDVLHRLFSFLGVDPGLAPAVPPVEVNKGDDKMPSRPLPRPVRSALRRLVAVGLSPQTAHRASTRLVTAPRTPAPVVSPDLRRRLEDALRDDSERMRAWIGDHVDGWSVSAGHLRQCEGA